MRIVIISKLNIVEGKYINVVSEFENIVYASVPITLCLAIDKEKIKKMTEYF